MVAKYHASGDRGPPGQERKKRGVSHVADAPRTQVFEVPRRVNEEGGFTFGRGGASLRARGESGRGDLCRFA